MLRPALPSLTGLRLIAAGLIVFFHAVPVIFRLPASSSLQIAASKCAPLGMTLFFVLSGFIIHYNYASRVTCGSVTGLWQFFVARVSRLYPMFLVLLAVDLIGGNLLIVASKEQLSIYLGALPYFLTMTQSWFYGYVGNVPIAFPYHYSHVAWSISTEMFLYLTYPLFAWWLIKAKLSGSIALATLILIGLSATLKYLLLTYPSVFDNAAHRLLGIVDNPNANPRTRFSDWLLYLSPYGRLLEFAAGACIAQYLLITQTGRHKRIVTALGWLAVPLLIIMFRRQTPVMWAYILAVPIACAAIVAAASLDNWYSRGLSAAWLVMLGEASYSIYLLHVVIIEKFAAPYGLAFPDFAWPKLIARFVLICGIIGLISVATYRTIEVPAQRWLRRILQPKKQVSFA